MSVTTFTGDFIWNMGNPPGLVPTGAGATHAGAHFNSDDSTVLSTYQINATAVPEPSSALLLVGCGLGLLSRWRRR
jgi:hypothetical protein